MVENVEISDLDLRYESYRMRHEGSEKVLLCSIAEYGIREPLEGVNPNDCRILLNGFKRCRCAKKLGINIVPYVCLGSDEVMGLIQLLRISNARSLTILEQAKLVDELKKVHGLSVLEIARQVEKSKGWVSMRMGIIGRMSERVRECIFTGKFPAYSYMYTLEKFIRMNFVKKEEIDEFVNSVAGKHLSIRNIERLAYGYFKGSDNFREQIKKGNIAWVFDRLKDRIEAPGCNESEKAMLRDLEIVGKYMQKVMFRINDTGFKNNTFYSQANLLAGGILSKIDTFSKTLRSFYDRTGQAQGNLFTPRRRDD
jgi:hypothetical protein